MPASPDAAVCRRRDAAPEWPLKSVPVRCFFHPVLLFVLPFAWCATRRQHQAGKAQRTSVCTCIPAHDTCCQCCQNWCFAALACICKTTHCRQSSVPAMSAMLYQGLPAHPVPRRQVACHLPCLMRRSCCDRCCAGCASRVHLMPSRSVLSGKSVLWPASIRRLATLCRTCPTHAAFPVCAGAAVPPALLVGEGMRVMASPARLPGDARTARAGQRSLLYDPAGDDGCAMVVAK